MFGKLISLLILLVFFVRLLPAQVDRTKMPGPGPAPATAFPDYEKRVSSNGIRVIIVKNKELPTIDIQLLIDRRPILEGEFAGYVDLAGELLRTGTATRTKDQLDSEVGRIGASISSSGTGLFASGLSRYSEELIKLTADVLLHPSFPKEELDKLLTQTVSGLKARKTEPDQIVEIVRNGILFGEKHPYGEVETEETIGRVTREKCIDLYNAYFKPNAAIVAVVGDIEPGTAMGLIEKYFGGWQQGSIPVPAFDTPKPLEHVMVALVDRPGAPQSVLRVSQTVILPRTSPDVISGTVMNTILGGGSAFRLNTNLREKHAYTYGASSSLSPDEFIGSFTARTSAKSAVTDSAAMEILAEIRRLREEKVSVKELQMAKNYLSGAFVRSLENARTVAGYAIDLERYKLPAQFFQEYLKNIDAVNADDVQRVAQAYLTPDRILLAVVGPAKEISARLASFGHVAMYDEEGKPVVDKPLTGVTIKADDILTKFMDKTGGKAKWGSLKDKTFEFSGKVKNFEMKVRNVFKAPNMMYQEVEVPGMFKQTVAFDGKKGWSVTPKGSNDITGEQLEGIKVQSLMNLYTSYRKMGFTALVTGMKTIKGKNCYEITFSRPTMGSLRHYFNADDFLKIREVRTVSSPQGDVDQTTDYGEYKDVNGFRVPTKYEQSAMGQVVILTLKKFTVNSGVKDAIFRKPGTN